MTTTMILVVIHCLAVAIAAPLVWDDDSPWYWRTGALSAVIGNTLCAILYANGTWDADRWLLFFDRLWLV